MHLPPFSRRGLKIFFFKKKRNFEKMKIFIRNQTLPTFAPPALSSLHWGPFHTSVFVQKATWARWKDKAQEKNPPYNLANWQLIPGLHKAKRAPSKGGWNVAVPRRKKSPSAAVTQGAGWKSANQHAFKWCLESLTDTTLPRGRGAFAFKLFLKLRK